MNSNTNRVKSFLFILLALATSAHTFATAGEKFVVRTNWSEKTITNQVEVRMPRNIFVSQYFTNYTDSFHTNTVVTYVTNIFTKTLTNTVALNLVRTNYIAKTITNEIPVELVQTNFVALYRTNLQTLNFTNWQTVLVMTTNWVTQTLTNTVKLKGRGPPVWQLREAKPIPTFHPQANLRSRHSEPKSRLQITWRK